MPYDISEILLRLKQFRSMSEQEDEVDQLAAILMEEDFYEMLSEDDRQIMSDLLDEYDAGWDNIRDIEQKFWTLVHRTEYQNWCIRIAHHFYLMGFLLLILSSMLSFGQIVNVSTALICFTIGTAMGAYARGLHIQFLDVQESYLCALRDAPSFEEVVGKFVTIAKCAR